MARASVLSIRRRDLAGARHLLADLLLDAGLPTSLIDDAGLLTAELAANVQMHTQSDAEITLRVSDAELHISVRDDDDALPTVRPVDALTVGGNGLLIVEQVATSWGTAHHVDGGKSVWFTLDRDRR